MPDSSKLTKGEKRRAEIIAHARRVLIDDGYDSLVMRSLANQAGMKVGNLQYYFATREDLIEAVGQAELDRNLEILDSIVRTPGTQKAVLKKLVQKIVTHWQQEGGRIFAVMSLLALHQRRFSDFHRQMYMQFYAALSDLLSTFAPDLPRAALMHKARLATALLDGALFQIPLSEAKNGNREFLDELTDAIILLLEAKHLFGSDAFCANYWHAK